MSVALVVVSALFAITLGLLLFGPKAPPRTGSTSAPHPDSDRVKSLEADGERRRREAEEAKAQLAELRAELKQAKRKLHEQRATEKDEQDLVRARTDVERSASQQLEVVRGELAHALAELAKLRADAETSRSRRVPTPVHPLPAAPASVPVPVPASVSSPPPEPERAVRRFRELTDTDREKMERLEHQANRERARAQEMQGEVRRLKGRTETQHRVWVVTKGELDLLKDKFKALEKRLNRTLLERDLMKRAIADLERRGGLAAGRTELTQEEIAASDQGVEDRSRAEAERLERRTGAVAVGTEPSTGTEAPPPPAEAPAPELTPEPETAS